MGAGTGQIVIYTSGTYTGDLENLTSDYTLYSKEWATNPHTGQPWTWDEVNALLAGVRLEAKDTEEEEFAKCTKLYVEVEYTPVLTGIARPLVGGSLAGNSLVGKGLARCI